ncbi:MAG: amidohydrolase family protein, partial [Spirochaetes bacterium]|nr:amidohydrolase family protein [Spirochaetota bacterium]
MNTKIIDVHTHAFPDFLAEKAIFSLAENSKEYKPFTDGTINGLLESMKKSGIEKSFIANIATKPEQVIPILDWSKKIHSNKIIPLGSFHPQSDNWQQEIDAIRNAGLPGIKLHPMYQNFTIDDKSMFPIYEYISQKKLFILMHAGYDVAFPKDRRALPFRIKNIIKDFPKLILIAAHLGAWRDWKNAAYELIGKNVF